MYNFEYDASPEVMLKYMWMDASKMLIVNQTEILTRAMEWIAPRVNKLMSYSEIHEQTHRANRETATLVEKIEAVCNGLNVIGITQGKPMIQTERVIRFARNMWQIKFGPFRKKLMTQAKPMLIEWMLALVVYESGYRQVRQAHRIEDVTNKAANKILERVRKSKDRVTRAQEEVDKLEKYIEEQNQALVRKRSVLEHEKRLFQENQMSLEGFMEDHPGFFKDENEEERAESD